MTEVIAILVTIIVGLLGFATYKSDKLKEQKQKTETQAAKAQILQKQMESVNEVQNSLKEAQSETSKPETVEKASGGDSASRLERLNKLQNSSKRKSGKQ